MIADSVCVHFNIRMGVVSSIKKCATKNVPELGTPSSVTL